jgi:CDP-diacylglycerol--glycerol-3-phosphate 3-phosphatidyltransferase/cardiolipin synthase
MLTIPNILTLLRILLIPVFVVVFYLPYHWAHMAAAAIFTLGAITDWLDGYLARRLGQISALGAFLDPVADKLAVAVALVLLVSLDPGVHVALPAAVIIGREITISALREWMAEVGKRKKVAVSLLGKVKTVSQMLALICMLYRDPVGTPLGTIPTYDAGLLLLYVAAALTLWSMCRYLLLAWPDLRQEGLGGGSGGETGNDAGGDGC